jgi:ABC-2 type transport system ATP-binding protein
MTPDPNPSGYAVDIDALTHTYSRRRQQPRTALDSVSLRVSKGEIFGLLGPNGSGKSTLFRILSTILGPTAGRAEIFGFDVTSEPDRVRQRIGVVFQHPSLDSKLTVWENLAHHGHLHGLRGQILHRRIPESLARIKLDDRANELVENLSGGLQRRVELAKSFLHRPDLLLLDEPSTGLDPGARRELGEYLGSLRDETGLTALLTTHILDEAERCDRIAILHRGKVVAMGTPLELKQEIGGDVISVAAKNPAAVADQIQQRLGVETLAVGGMVRIERRHGHAFIPQLVEAIPGQIDSITVSKPTLEDVFIHKTGQRFWEEERLS